jgi:hypothetical protein
MDRKLAAAQHLSQSRRSLDRLRTGYKFVVLSDCNLWCLDHLVKNVSITEFDGEDSVELGGIFKPSAAAYRRAARERDVETAELLMSPATPSTSWVTVPVASAVSRSTATFRI